MRHSSGGNLAPYFNRVNENDKFYFGIDFFYLGAIAIRERPCATRTVLPERNFWVEIFFHSILNNNCGYYLQLSLKSPAMPSPTAIITGASSGIGRDLALVLAREGYDLGLIARREDLLGQLKSEIIQKYPARKVICKICDVMDLQCTADTIETLSKELGRLDIFVANAGLGHSTPAWKNDAKITLDIFQVNVMGAVASLEAAKAIILKQRSGHLVGISSVAANRGLPASSAYCASKAALSVYLEALRVDLKGLGITVSSIHPGFIATPMTSKNGKMPFLLDSSLAAEKIFRAIVKKKKRYVFPWQMAFLYQLLRFMPNGLYDCLMGLQSKKGVFKA